jgi:hypothetical protein
MAESMATMLLLATGGIMSEKSDDPRDEVATLEAQRSDQDARRAERKRAGRQPAEVRTMDDDLDEGGDDERLSESRPTPGSAEGERDVRAQSDSNVPRRDEER